MGVQDLLKYGYCNLSIEELGLLIDKEMREPYDKLFCEWETMFPGNEHVNLRNHLHDMLWDILRPCRDISYFAGIQHGIELKNALESDNFALEMYAYMNKQKKK